MHWGQQNGAFAVWRIDGEEVRRWRVNVDEAHALGFASRLITGRPVHDVLGRDLPIADRINLAGDLIQWVRGR